MDISSLIQILSPNTPYLSHILLVCALTHVSPPQFRRDMKKIWPSAHSKRSILLRYGSIVACPQKTPKWEFLLFCYHYHSSKELKSGNSHSVPGKCHTLGAVAHATPRDYCIPLSLTGSWRILDHACSRSAHTNISGF